MAVSKLSVALENEVAEAARSSAERAGISLSAWLNHAAENALAVEAGLDAVRDWEADHGELSEAELAEADAVLDQVLQARRAG